MNRRGDILEHNLLVKPRSISRTFATSVTKSSWLDDFATEAQFYS